MTFDLPPLAPPFGLPLISVDGAEGVASPPPAAKTRNYLTSAGSQYATLDTPWEPSANFSIQFDFCVPAGAAKTFIGKEGSLKIDIEGSNIRVLFATSGSGWGVDIHSTSITPYVDKLNTAKFVFQDGDESFYINDVLVSSASATGTRSSSVIVEAIGASNSGGGYLFTGGVIANVILTDLDTSTVTAWDVGSGSTTTEESTPPGNPLTYINVAAGHWEEFTLTGNEWLSADYVGELYGNSGTAQDDTDFFKLGEGDYQIKNASGAWKSKNFSKTPTLGHRYKYSYNGYAHGGAGVHQVKIGTNVTSTPVDGVYSGYKVANGSNFQVRNSTASTGVDHWIKFKDFTIHRVLEIAA
ncbi:MAG: hypothetical protein RPU59_13975 [Candidatus Sedimenticola sp. (ex Thyasira tokunagai)]